MEGRPSSDNPIREEFHFRGLPLEEQEKALQGAYDQEQMVWTASRYIQLGNLQTLVITR